MLWAGGGQVIRGRVGRSKGAAEIWRFGTRSAAARAADVRRLRSLSQGWINKWWPIIKAANIKAEW